jgi:glycosyltransferase involved in cell wall biosynthesis
VPNLPKVIMAEFSDVRYDARVLKEAKTISENGYFVFLYMYNTSINRRSVYVEGNIKYHVYPFAYRRNNSSNIAIMKKYYEAVVFLIRVNVLILFANARIYHAHNLRFLLSTFLSSILHKGLFVYDAHEIHSEHYENISVKGRIKNGINMIAEKIVLLRCHAFIQASEERAIFIAKKYRIAKPYVINNYVPFRRYSSTSSNLLRNKIKLSSDSIILFYSGGVYADRLLGFENVISALVHYKSIHLVIVGFMNIDIKSRIEQLYNSKSLDDRIHLLPPVENSKLFDYAASADIGLIPLMGLSLNTKLSALNKISEYLMAGLPLLSSNYDNLSNLIYNNPFGQVGETFDINSIKSITYAIDKLIMDERYKKLKPVTFKLSHKVLNWENEEKKIKEIYASIDSTT